MNEVDKPGWLLAIMICWYVILLFAAAALVLFGMAFGSEAYRNDPIPITEQAMIFGPFIVTTAFLIGTVVLWSKGKIGAATKLWGFSFFVLLALLAVLRIAAI